MAALRKVMMRYHHFVPHAGTMYVVATNMPAVRVVCIPMYQESFALRS